MPEFECPFEADMRGNPKEVRDVVIRGENVRVEATVAGRNLTRDCILEEINKARLSFYPGQISEHMYCDRCGRGIKLPKEFVDSLYRKPPSAS